MFAKEINIYTTKFHNQEPHFGREKWFGRNKQRLTDDFDAENESHEPNHVNLSVPQEIFPTCSPLSTIDCRVICTLKPVAHWAYFFRLQMCMCYNPRRRHILFQGKILAFIVLHQLVLQISCACHATPLGKPKISKLSPCIIASSPSKLCKL